MVPNGPPPTALAADEDPVRMLFVLRLAIRLVGEVLARDASLRRSLLVVVSAHLKKKTMFIQ